MKIQALPGKSFSTINVNDFKLKELLITISSELRGRVSGSTNNVKKVASLSGLFSTPNMNSSFPINGTSSILVARQLKQLLMV